MSGFARGKWKGWGVFGVLLVCLGVLAWRCVNTPETYISLMEHWTEGNDSQARAAYVDKIVAMGSRSIGPVIRAIGESGTRSRRTWQLNVALQRLGQPAHLQLLQAIDTDKDPFVRVHYVDSLQTAFNDFSRLHIWLAALKTNADFNKRNLRHTERDLRQQLMYRFDEDVPPFFVDDNFNKMNPRFVTWYQGKEAPKGPLPHWKP